MSKYVFEAGYVSGEKLEAEAVTTSYIKVEHEEVKSLKVAFQVAVTKAFELKKPKETVVFLGLIEAHGEKKGE